MADEKTRKPPTRKKGGGGGGKGYDGDGEPQSPGKKHGGDPVLIHEAYVRRHIEGGTEATIEAYERAAEQFQKLKGAVRRPIITRQKARPDEAEDDKTED